MNNIPTITPHVQLWRFTFVNRLHFVLHIVGCDPFFITYFDIFEKCLVRMIHSILELVTENGNYL